MDELPAADPFNAPCEAIDRLDVSPAPVAADRKWADLPCDVLSLIFRKVGAVDVLKAAQCVCRPWQDLTLEPETWRVVDMTMGTDSHYTFHLEFMARLAIIRSNGLVEEFYAKRFACESLVNFIAESTNRLRRLGLIDCQHSISDEALIEVAKKSPDLEYLEIPMSSCTDKLVKSVGEACPRLRHFVHFCPTFLQCIAFPAACTKELRRLRLVGCEFTADVLNSTLDSCHRLVSLESAAALFGYRRQPEEEAFYFSSCQSSSPC